MRLHGFFSNIGSATDAAKLMATRRLNVRTRNLQCPSAIPGHLEDESSQARGEELDAKIAGRDAGVGGFEDGGQWGDMERRRGNESRFHGAFSSGSIFGHDKQRELKAENTRTLGDKGHSQCTLNI